MIKLKMLVTERTSSVIVPLALDVLMMIHCDAIKLQQIIVSGQQIISRIIFQIQKHLKLKYYCESMAEDEESAGSSSSSIPDGVPGGSTLSFLPVIAGTSTVHSAATNDDDGGDSDSSSSSSVPMGVPGGGDDYETLSFLPMTTTTAAANSPSKSMPVDLPKVDEEGVDESSDDDESAVGLPGGGPAVHLVPTQAVQRQRVSRIQPAALRTATGSVPGPNGGGGHMTMVCFDRTFYCLTATVYSAPRRHSVDTLSL